MKKIVIKSFLLLGLLVLVTNYILDPIFSTNNIYSNTIKDFFKEETNSFNMIIVGSSHAKSAYIPGVIDSIFKINSYNLGTGGQRYLTTNYLIEETLKKKNVDLVIVDLYPILMRIPEKPNTKGFQLRVIDHTSLSLEKIKLINKLYNFDEFASVYSQTIRNHKEWFNIELSDINENTSLLFSNGWVNTNQKFKKKDSLKYKDFLKENTKLLNIEPNKNELLGYKKIEDYIDETIRICSKYDAKVIFVSAPYLTSFYNQNNNKKHFYLNDYFINKGLDFIDFNTKFNEINLSLEDFKDEGHLNANGAKKATIYMSKFLKEKNHYKVRNEAYYNKQLTLIKPRTEAELARRIKISEYDFINKIKKQGQKNSQAHTFNDSISIKNTFLYLEKGIKYILFENNTQIPESYLNRNPFLVRGEIYEKDFDKRPKWLLGTKKDKIFWETKGSLVKMENKAYILLDLTKKGNLDEFISLDFFMKTNNKFNLKNNFKIKEAKFIAKN